jgi:hypothetical protein
MTEFPGRTMLGLSEKRAWSGAAFMLSLGCPGPGPFVFYRGRWEEVDVAPVDWLTISSVLTDSHVASDLNSCFYHSIRFGDTPK